MPINVPWVKLPKTNYEQLRNGKRGVIFKLSPQYVGKILYSEANDIYNLRDDKKSLTELIHEENITKKLYENKIGNVPKPIGIEKLRLLKEKVYPVFIMEYLTLPRGDEINYLELSKANSLAIEEFGKALDIGLIADYDSIAIGLMVHNVGGHSLKWSTDQEETIEMKQTLGVLLRPLEDITMQGDVILVNDQITYNLGGQWNIASSLGILGGVKDITGNQSWRLGLSLNLGKVTWNYAYSQHVDLGVIHKLAVEVNL